MQKTMRSYGGEWRRLCDLVRASLVFDDVADIAKCLAAIFDDSELVVLKVGDDKMRLRADFDAKSIHLDVSFSFLFHPFRS